MPAYPWNAYETVPGENVWISSADRVSANVHPGYGLLGARRVIPGKQLKEIIEFMMGEVRLATSDAHNFLFARFKMGPPCTTVNDWV